MRTILIGSDHAGFDMKSLLVDYLAQTFGDVTVKDIGVNTRETPADYPDIGHFLAKEMKKIPDSLGILICGSGVGASIVVNRYHHIRAALCNDPLSATLSRGHNNANVLCLGARLIGPAMASACIDAFLTTSFSGGRHEARILKINEGLC